MAEIFTWLTEPFQYAFMLRGLGAALIVGVVCPVLGAYVVLRGMAFFGDALAHIVLPGVVIAFLLDLPMALGALVVGLLAALAINAISQRTDIREDAAIGVVFAGAFALGVALISTQRGYALDLAHILFGNLLGVTTSDLWLMGGLSAVVLLVILSFYKEFLVLSFDPVLATTLRLPVKFLGNLLMMLLAVAIVISLKAVGVALVLAMLVTPASTAYLMTQRLPTMMLLAAAIGAISSLLGLYLSFYVDMASGAAIVLIQTGFFFLAYLIRPRQMGRAGKATKEPPGS
jgi:ABC-type Mn2+/Zn2+ transport system permease subunit